MWHYLPEFLIENSPCLPGVAAESSVENSSAGEPSVPWKSSRTAAKTSCADKGTVCSTCSQSGTTCEPSTADRGVERWILSLVGSPVPTSALPERAKESPENFPNSGRKWRESLAKFDPASCSWKTRQRSLLGGLMSFSATFPRWGTMRNGELFQQRMPSGLAELREYITTATESGLSQQAPTPLASDGAKGEPNQRGAKGDLRLSSFAVKVPTPNCPNGGRAVPQDADWATNVTAYRADGKKIQVGLESYVRRVPTPTASDGKGGPGCSGRDGGDNLRTYVSKVPTPISSNHRSGKVSAATMEKNSRPPNEVIGGSLNPPWVEWLQGFPIGFTDLQPLETHKFQSWLRSHTASLNHAYELE